MDFTLVRRQRTVCTLSILKWGCMSIVWISRRWPSLTKLGVMIVMKIAWFSMRMCLALLWLLRSGSRGPIGMMFINVPRRGSISGIWVSSGTLLSGHSIVGIMVRNFMKHVTTFTSSGVWRCWFRVMRRISRPERYRVAVHSSINATVTETKIFSQKWWGCRDEENTDTSHYSEYLEFYTTPTFHTVL